MPKLSSYIFRKSPAATLIAIIMMTAACSEGGVGGPPGLRSDAPAATKHAVPVQLFFKLRERKSALAVASSAAMRNKAIRRLEYISPSNTSISITVTPIGGSPTTYGPSACTLVSCVISFTTTPGANTLNFLLTDGINALSTFTTIVMVQPSTINTLKFTANPVVNSVSLSLASPSLNAGIVANDLLTVNAQDKDGNVITGKENYVDINGNQVVLSLNVSNNQAGGKGTVNIIGPLLISAPQQAAIYAHYDGNWLDNSTISVTSNSSAIASLTGATLTTIPHVIEYSVTGNPQGITTGPDGNLWYIENIGDKIGKMNVSGTTLVQYTCFPCDRSQYITSGIDGNLWFTGGVDDNVYKMTINGVLTLVASVGSAYPKGIATAPDGSIWFSYNNATTVGRISSSGVVTSFVIAGDGDAMNVGPDGNMWFTDISNKIGRVTPSGIVTEYAVTNDTGSSDGIVTGPDGNIWFTEYNGNRIGKSTTAFVITEYATQAGANPRRIIVGPDQNLWFTESGTSSIGRISTTGLITEYGAAYGITAGSGPQDLTVGPDGNIWFTQWNANAIGKFVY